MKITRKAVEEVVRRCKANGAGEVIVPAREFWAQGGVVRLLPDPQSRARSVRPARVGPRLGVAGSFRAPMGGMSAALTATVLGASA